MMVVIMKEWNKTKTSLFHINSDYLLTIGDIGEENIDSFIKN